MIGNLTYENVKELVTNNPNITAQEFGEKLKQNGTTDANICDLFIDILRSGKDDIVNDHDTFLKTVKLLAKSDIKINIGDTTSKTVLDYAVVGEQLDVIKIFLNNGKFDQERKSNALLTAVNEGKVQEFEIFLDYMDHTKILEVLNTSPHNESTEVMKILLNNKRFTGEGKVQVLIGAAVDDDLPKVRLLLKYMTGIPESGIRNLLEMIKESKSPFEEELRTASEFKVDFSNSDHCTYLSNRVIIALLRSAVNNTPNVGENETGSSTETAVLDSNYVIGFYTRIARTINSISFEDLQRDLNKQKVSLQSKCEQGAVLGSALLERAIKDQKLNVINFLLQNGVTIISATDQEGRYYVSKIEESKSILCSVVYDTDDDNAEILSTLLQSVNTEQSKLDPESELYRLYQQLKDDTFCTAFAEKNALAAKVLIQNDQKIRESAINKDETPVVTGTDQVVTTPSVEENRTEPNKNISNKPTATVPSILTKKTNSTTVPNSGNGRSVSNKPVSPVVSTNAGTPTMSSGNDKSSNFTNAQFSRPKETKYKENFHNLLKKDAVGVVVTGLFIAAAVMIPSVVGAVICGVAAALIVIATGLHIANSTLPSYRKMRENKIEHVNSSLRNQEL